MWDTQLTGGGAVPRQMVLKYIYVFIKLSKTGEKASKQHFSLAFCFSSCLHISVLHVPNFHQIVDCGVDM